MARYMLDTDIASYLIRGDKPSVIDAFRKKFNEVVISAITSAELQYGAKKRNRPPLTKKVLALCDLIPCVEWSAQAAEKYAGLQADLEVKGTPIGAMDMLIAAAALAEEAVLVTNNTAHFAKVAGLKLENWVSESFITSNTP